MVSSTEQPEASSALEEKKAVSEHGSVEGESSVEKTNLENPGSETQVKAALEGESDVEDVFIYPTGVKLMLLTLGLCLVTFVVSSHFSG